MQPYFFPYLGYFQLIHAVDTFVLLDDVNFIKGGWINRNRILINGGAAFLTVPLAKASQNRRINETRIHDDPAWKQKLLRSLTLAYRHAPSFEAVFPLLECSLLSRAEYIPELARSSIEAVAGYLGLATRLVASSAVYGNDHLRGEERIIDICRREQASGYVNLPGGRDLYHAGSFRRHGIALHFLEPGAVDYPQPGPQFVPNLSIIDVLMFNPREAVLRFLKHYTLVDAAHIS